MAGSRRTSRPSVADRPPAAPRTPRQHVMPDVLLWMILVALTLAAYQPAWRGGVLWDDAAHLTSDALASADGLRRIWFDVGATQQYYPATHSAFWVLNRIAGHDTLPYHLVTIVLHASSAFLVFALLRTLAVPGALAAACVFALHPVHVESVAWMTELKNTLSGLWFLLAALAYVRFEASRSRLLYGLALTFFVLAVLTKSVTAILPAALLVVAWWRRGTVDMRRDVLPLVPMFVVAAVSGIVTAWFERSILAASGPEYALTVPARLILAGRALWFYAGTVAWPADLMFIYPRWRIDPGSALQYVPLALACAVVTGLWLMRGRTRAPLAAALLFAGLLTPALGFVSVYPFRYSYVADHFQYLATIPLIAGLCAALMLALRRWMPAARIDLVLAAAAVFVLGPLTHAYSRSYIDSDTLFAATLARNPDCWLCHNNLASSRLHGNDAEFAEALVHLQEAVRLNPLSAEVHNNLGAAYQRQRRFADALREHETALALNPSLVDARYDLGVTYQATGDLERARAAYERVIVEHQDFAAAHNNLGIVLQAQGQMGAALEHMNAAARLDPSNPGPRLSVAAALLTTGRLDEAASAFQQALALDPASAQAHSGLATILLQRGRVDEALVHVNAAVGAAGGSAAVRDAVGLDLLRAGQAAAATDQFRAALARDPSYAPAHYHLALVHIMANRPADAVTDLREAVRLDPNFADAHHDLGAALANLGRYDEAAREFRETLRLQPEHASARANLAAVEKR